MHGIAMLSRAAKRHTRIRFGKIKQKHLLKNKERGIFMAELTPMMKQYLEIKKDNPDSILFFRLGDCPYSPASI